MSFQSLEFLAFLAGSAVLCRLWSSAAVRRRTGGYAAANAVPLLLLSLLFCWRGCASPVLLVPVLLSLCVTWFAAQSLRSGQRGRKVTFVLAAAWHIAILVFYKYAAFLTGGRMDPGPAPLGLSFFTFQQLWLLHELYTGGFSLERGEWEAYGAYSLFFPSVSSGPILRPRDFFPRLREGPLRAESGDFAAGLYAISLGMAKKVLLADPLGTLAANGWALGPDLTAPAAWAVILGYSLRLYLDFSGYCDIACGAARLLGLRLPMNFDGPYRACSVGDFWKRWHITLTSFLRQCVYFPLGGSRRGTVRTCLNILAVYLISGAWHGAGWTFLVWGLLHGLAQVAERLWPGRERLPKALRWAMTFLFVNLAWVFFQAPSLTAALDLLRSAVLGGGGLPLDRLTAGVLDSEATALRTLLPFAARAVPGLVLAGLLAAGLAVSLAGRSVYRRMEDFRPTGVSAAVCGVLLAWAVLSFSSTATFIYSNF